MSCSSVNSSVLNNAMQYKKYLQVGSVKWYKTVYSEKNKKCLNYWFRWEHTLPLKILEQPLVEKKHSDSIWMSVPFWLIYFHIIYCVPVVLFYSMWEAKTITAQCITCINHTLYFIHNFFILSVTVQKDHECTCGESALSSCW